jgi:parallel beta-helix repeat protein
VKKIMAIALALVLLLAIATPVSAATIDVDPGDSIQSAVDAASPGDTIIVHAGEYHQSVVIRTNDITLKGKTGAILDGTPPADTGTSLTGHGITVEAGASGVTIEGFEIRNYGSGILVQGASNNSVKKNEVSDSGNWGIELDDANDNEVLENKVTGSADVGISVRGSGNLIKQNKLADNDSGIVLGADDNQVIGNKVTGSTGTGISAWGSGNLIKQNRVSDSGLWDLYDNSAPPPLDNTWEKNKYGTANF